MWQQRARGGKEGAPSMERGKGLEASGTGQGKPESGTVGHGACTDKCFGTIAQCHHRMSRKTKAYQIENSMGKERKIKILFF